MTTSYLKVKKCTGQPRVQSQVMTFPFDLPIFKWETPDGDAAL